MDDRRDSNFNLEDLRKLQRKMKALAAAGVGRIIDEGSDEELSAARQSIPEPTHTPYGFYKVPIAPKLPPAFVDWSTLTEPTVAFSIAEFRRVLVRSGGAVFFAWQSLKDHLIYL